MKALQTRSPIHLFYQDQNLDKVDLSIWVSDTPEINSTSTPDYSLSSSAINGLTNFEISELVRSKNQYLYKADFYTKRDTAKYVLTKAIINKIYASKAEAQTAVNDFETRVTTDGGTFEAETCLVDLLSPIIKYDFLRVRDGYVTRQELPQIFKNLITTDISLWDTNFNTTITSGQTDAFGGIDAYLVNDTDNTKVFASTKQLDLEGVHTFSIWLKRNSTSNIFGLFANVSTRVDFDILNYAVTFATSNIISYDILRVGDYVKVSFVYDLALTDFFRIESREASINEEVFIFNPKVTKGNLLNNDASDLILQDNTTIYSDGVIIPKIGFDKKLANTLYNYGLTPITFTSQSKFLDVKTATLTYDQLDGTATTQDITLNELEECKFTPAKVSFVNRFGVIQDLVFFKKRVDSLKTSKEDYKANVLQGSEYYSHIGSKQNISKESERSITLNSGFYPEEFNTVFEQLQNSLYYWIDDEPAVLDGSSLEIKTRVNDKLINYTFDFSYGNNEINTI